MELTETDFLPSPLVRFIAGLAYASTPTCNCAFVPILNLNIKKGFALRDDKRSLTEREPARVHSARH